MEISSPATREAPVLARLATLLPDLRDSEQRVAEYVLARPEEMIYLSVTELAERSDTSEATVIRWAQRLGFAGYSALKIALALELRGGAPQADDLAPDSDLAAIKRKVIQVNVESLQDTLALLDDASLARAVEALLGARRIEVYAVGGTGVVAQDAAFMLMQIGLPVVALQDPHLQVMSAAQLRPGDAALGISLSGVTRDTVEALQVAREAGATCLCITRHARSPITRVADVTLLAAARPATIGGQQLFGRASQLAVVDVLAAALVVARPDASLAALARGREAVNSRKRF